MNARNPFSAALVLSILLLPSLSRAEGRLGYLTLGPTFHWNFSGYRFSAFSMGVELAYWNYARTWTKGFFEGDAIPDMDRPGYGLSVGCDGDWKGFRFYAEPQIGWVFAGFSLGPVLELSKAGGPAQWGIQGSGWANAVGGLDLRYRRLDGKNVQSLGLYAKLAKAVSGDIEAPE